MKVYETEKKDGLSEQITSKASVVFDSEIVLNLNQEGITEATKRAVADLCENPEQIDLYYLNSVLASTGLNKNDDYFGSEELWAARDTPVDKQFNYMHDEADIIGHITGSMVFNRDGEPIEECCDDFDLVTSAVIYTHWSDPDLKERMDAIIADIQEGKWAVSMECLFNDFDYAVLDNENRMRIVARTEESAFLTKHLRAYGGTGVYEGYKVNRALKQMVFSGKGLVNRPANPRSIIFPEIVHDSIPQITEFVMAEENVVETNDELVEAKATIQSLTEELDSVKAQLADVTEKFSQAQTDLKTALSQIRNLNRAEMLKDAGIENVSEVIAKFENADDESFAAMVDLIKSRPVVATTVEETEAEIDEDVLEQEVEETALAAEVEPASKALYEAAVAHIRKNVLKSTKNLK